LLEPRVIAAGSNIENFAHGLNAVFGLVQFNELVNLSYSPRARLRGHGHSLRWRILGHRLSTKYWELQPELQDLLDELRTDITQPELPDSEDDVIQVMSLHKSKGLTRDVVVVAGCMAGTLPFVDADDPPEVQTATFAEQRRLFYVAMTRPTKVLVLSAAAKLPLALALRGGAAVAKTEVIGGVSFAVTSLTPFIGELGGHSPKVLSGSEWLKHVGL
jgi:hypothetical protein